MSEKTLDVFLAVESCRYISINQQRGIFPERRQLEVPRMKRRLKIEAMETRAMLDGAGMVDMPSIPGDSNCDGLFNESDILMVFQAGKYNTGEAATWGDGDWNLDGVFDSSDLKEAFVVGRYRAGVVSNENSAHHRDDVPRGHADRDEDDHPGKGQDKKDDRMSDADDAPIDEGDPTDEDPATDGDSGEGNEDRPKKDKPNTGNGRPGDDDGGDG